MPKCLNKVKVNKYDKTNNIAKGILSMKRPTCLFWGLRDNIAPPKMGHEFY